MDERSIFMAVLERESAHERSAYLDEACGGDAALRQRVEALLASHEQAGSFLRKPVPERLAKRVATPEQMEETSGEASAAQEGRRTLPVGLGSRIGPYKLLQEVGEGGMGTVFLAEQSEPVRRLVALKIIKPGMDSRQVIARFEAERQALALMDHPNIARVLDGGTAGEVAGGGWRVAGKEENEDFAHSTRHAPPATLSGRPYFVMELVKGVPITRFCDERRMPPRERLELFVPVCQAVQHAHQKGIIHRDLKPSNVMVCLYDGKPMAKVIDFGIAKATGQKLTERTMFTEIGQVVGTLEYMSPEQAELNQLDIDTRSDIYSLGVLLYELLTGSTPLDRNRLKTAAMLEVLRLIREEEPPRPSTRLSGSKEKLASISAQRQTEPARLTKLVRGELDWIVMKALEKDRNRRYETANSFAMDVQRYLADEPVLACPPSGWYKLRKFVRRHQAGLLTAAALLLALIVAGGTVGWMLWDRAAQRAVRNAATERTVSVALVKAAQLAEHAQSMPGVKSTEAEAILVVWRQAEDALGQADAALTTGAGDDGLRERVANLRAQLANGRQQTEEARARALRKEKLFRDLDEARVARSARVDDHFDVAGSAARYAAAFAACGLEVAPDRKDELARRIAAEEPEVRDALIEALGDWAAVAEHAPTRLSAVELLTVARSADTNAWRKRFLNTRINHDRAALRSLSAEARRSSLPPSSLFALAWSLSSAGDHEEALAILRFGRSRHPRDFWLHFALGNLLSVEGHKKPTTLESVEAIGCYRAALALYPETGAVHANLASVLYDMRQLDEAIVELRETIRLKPDDADAHYNLGLSLHDRGFLDEAITAYRQAVQFRKDMAAAHLNLGNALRAKGKLDEAIAESRESIRLKADSPMAHNNIGLALQTKGQLDQAMVEYHRALRLKNDFPMALNNLGNVFQQKGQFDEAMAAFQEAIRFDKEFAGAHHGLGLALQAKGQLNEALAEIREAIRLKKDFIEAHHNLGVVLAALGNLDEAIAAFREAIRLDQDNAESRYSLGLALQEKGLVDEAIAAFRETIRVKDDHAKAHGNVGSLLQRKGQFRQALEEMRRSHELGSRDPGWPYRSADWVKECERLVELDGKLPGILQGTTRPASPGERIELARLCSFKRLYRTAARFYAEGLAEEPKLADNLEGALRYNAACAAALAGCGQGDAADNLDAAERARLRRQALDWLRADFAAWGRLLDKEPDRFRPAIVERMRHWLADTDFAGVRGSEALAKSPEAERELWQKLWSDVADTLASAAQGKQQHSRAMPK
jgi:serine/threonine protein kinase/tetratricopeptide (TPR) repeat protein